MTMELLNKTKEDGFVGNDNTLKLLGFDYQKLIALEKCLDAVPNEHIWIECKGDVADKNTSTEVKHHGSHSNLTSNSKDAWNTIKNYVENIQAAKSFDHLVLHTTSSLPENSIFHDWNNLTPSQKKIKLVKHTPSPTIKELHKKIKECRDEDLLAILERFSIYSDQPKIKEKWEELKLHSAFILIDKKFLDQAIELLYGYITKEAIDEAYIWKISINDFRHDMKHSLSKFTTEEIPFHFISKDDEDHIIDGLEFTFLAKMKDIKLREKDLQSAVSDYLRAQESQINMLRTSPMLEENFIKYDGNIKNDITVEKSSKSYNLTAKEIGTDHADKTSREVYFDCIKKPHPKITSVKDTEKYYRDGRIHHITEESEFEWKYRKDDLS